MADALPPLPRRPSDGHKGTFGTVCVIGGQAAAPRMMVGGPAFTAIAALRCGTGLAVLALPEPVLATGLAIAPSATGLALPVDDAGALRPSAVAELLDRELSQYDCVALGPGLGAGEPQQQIVVRLLAHTDVPLIIDADALNAMAACPDIQQDLRAPAVLTPHPGEFRRLAEALGISADPTAPDQRTRAAEELAQRLGSVVVLKGAATVVSDGVRSWQDDTSNPALATAGSGDVLTGLIAGLVAQFHRPHLGIGSRQVTPEQQGGLGLYDCARHAVRLHAVAATAWTAQHGDAGLLMQDLLDLVPDALRSIERG